MRFVTSEICDNELEEDIEDNFLCINSGPSFEGVQTNKQTNKQNGDCYRIDMTV